MSRVGGIFIVGETIRMSASVRSFARSKRLLHVIRTSHDDITYVYEIVIEGGRTLLPPFSIINNTFAFLHADTTDVRPLGRCGW